MHLVPSHIACLMHKDATQTMSQPWDSQEFPIKLSRRRSTGAMACLDDKSRDEESKKQKRSQRSVFFLFTSFMSGAASKICQDSLPNHTVPHKLRKQFVLSDAMALVFHSLHDARVGGERGRIMEPTYHAATFRLGII